MITFSNLGKFGKLGNQLFQIATVYSYAKKYGYSYTFPEWKYNRYLKDPLVSGSINPGGRYYHQDPFSYVEIPRGDNKDLMGYFQNERYFSDNKMEILEMLTVADWVKNQVDQSFFDEKITAVHVRRGDYLKFPSHHPLPPIDYYFKSIDELSSNTDKILIFSDDIEWCEENFGTSFFYSEEKDEFIDLYKMSLCTNFIIANSSFSWWGSYLSNKEGITIAPNNWVGDSYKETRWREVYRKNMLIR